MSHRAAKQIRQDARHDGFKRLREIFRDLYQETREFNEMMRECREHMEAKAEKDKNAKQDS